MFEKEIFKAARSGDLKGVKKRIGSVRDILMRDAKSGDTLLHAAVRGDLEVVELGDMCGYLGFTSSKNKAGLTPYD